MENKFKVNFSNDEVIITDLKNFNIKQVVECGQCFRWKKVKENDYIGVAFRKVIEVIQEDDKLLKVVRKKLALEVCCLKLIN